MIDIFKKTLLAGLGATITTKEKIEATLNDLVDKGKITADEARAAADKISEEGRKEFEEMGAQFDSGFQAVLQKMKVVTEDQLQALEARVAQLEEKLAETEGEGDGGP